MKVGAIIDVKVTGGKVASFQAKLRLDTEVEIAYFKNGGILQYVVRKLLAEDKKVQA